MEKKEEIKCIKCGRTCKECGLDTLGVVEGIGVILLRELVEEEYELWFVCDECWNGKKSKPTSPDELQLVRSVLPGRVLTMEEVNEDIKASKEK